MRTRHAETRAAEFTRRLQFSFVFVPTLFSHRPVRVTVLGRLGPAWGAVIVPSFVNNKKYSTPCYYERDDALLAIGVWLEDTMALL